MTAESTDRARLRYGLGISRVTVGGWVGVSDTTVMNYEQNSGVSAETRAALDKVYEAMGMLAMTLRGIGAVGRKRVVL